MQGRFCRDDGLYRRDGRAGRMGVAAHLWPFIRAVVATLDVAGVAPDLIPGFEAEAEIARRWDALERYWDRTAPSKAYRSDVVGSRFGGDRYYDDNAWVGLALVQLERVRPGSGHLNRAAELFAFAVRGWDTRPDPPHPGGVFWVEQDVGAGRRNHDRNAVSTAPNAELGLHLAELSGPPRAPAGAVGASEMYAWVATALDAGGAAGEPGTGLFWDKWRGDGSLDRALWTYNQGSMIGANVLLARAAVAAADPERDRYTARAEAIAHKALRHYAGDALAAQPYAFNAILFRNLLLLTDASTDAALTAEIRDVMCRYADRDDFASGARTLLDLSAVVQILALLAWDPAGYGRLA
jgi:predicted alpha-1,6-mannanase (GH76 family)